MLIKLIASVVTVPRDHTTRAEKYVVCSEKVVRNMSKCAVLSSIEDIGVMFTNENVRELVF